MLLSYGEHALLIQAVVELNRQILSRRIFVDRIPAKTRRRDADKCCQLAIDMSNDVFIERVQRIAEHSFRVLRVLAKFHGIYIVAHRVNGRPVCRRGHRDASFSLRFNRHAFVLISDVSAWPKFEAACYLRNQWRKSARADTWVNVVTAMKASQNRGLGSTLSTRLKTGLLQPKDRSKLGTNFPMGEAARA